MLKRVSIQNFKSLKDVTLDLQKVNLLIGPNNSGKTNFLKALEYFQDRINYKYYDGDEFERTQFKHDKNHQIEIEMTKVLHNGTFAHVLLETNPDVTESEVTYSVLDSLGQKFGTSSIVYHLNDESLRASGMGLTNRIVDFLRVKGFIGPIRIYRIDSADIVKLNELNPDEYIYEDASNLTSFILNLSQNHRQALETIESQLTECVGDIVGLATPTVKTGSQAKLRLKLFDKFGMDFWADEVSEGTLYFLALLCIINQPKPPKLLLLEEPEKGIHPRRIREVMDFIFRLAEEKDVQIILTTHNEHVLDDFSTRPESVFVFDKDDEGATYVRNLQRDIIEPTNARNKELGLDDIDLTTNLSENWLYGLLGGVPSIS